MKLHDLSPAAGSNTDKIREGRGTGARRGEKTGRGTKGQKKRSTVPLYFEGGQTPLYRRLPKFGFTPHSPGPEPEIVNVRSLERYSEGDTVSPEKLQEDGLINDTQLVKLLGDGEVETSLTVKVHEVSGGAREKIQDAGGQVEIIPSEAGG